MQVETTPMSPLPTATARVATYPRVAQPLAVRTLSPLCPANFKSEGQKSLHHASHTALIVDRPLAQG